MIVLSARGRERDEVTALDLGAMAYVSKPFGMEELLARAGAVLHRSARGAHPMKVPLRLGDIEIDVHAQRGLRNGEPVRLTRIEMSLLPLLVRNSGKVLPHKAILSAVWWGYTVEKEYLWAYMSHLVPSWKRIPMLRPSFSPRKAGGIDSPPPHCEGRGQEFNAVQMACEPPSEMKMGAVHSEAEERPDARSEGLDLTSSRFRDSSGRLSPPERREWKECRASPPTDRLTCWASIFMVERKREMGARGRLSLYWGANPNLALSYSSPSSPPALNFLPSLPPCGYTLSTAGSRR